MYTINVMFGTRVHALLGGDGYAPGYDSAMRIMRKALNKR